MSIDSSVSGEIYGPRSPVTYRNNFLEFLIAPCRPNHFLAWGWGSVFKGKNLLLDEPTLSFKSWPCLRSEAKGKWHHCSPKNVAIHLNEFSALIGQLFYYLSEGALQPYTSCFTKRFMFVILSFYYLPPWA